MSAARTWVSAPKKGRGRKKGEGGYALADAPLVLEMHKLLEQGEAISLWDATRFVVGRAAGPATEDSKRKRLVGRFYRMGFDLV